MVSGDGFWRWFLEMVSYDLCVVIIHIMTILLTLTAQIKAGKARIGASGDPLAEIPFAALKRTRRTSEQVLNFLHIACKDGLNVLLGG
jgi:hypothetical protein